MGTIYSIGIGPALSEFITPQARQILDKVDTVIGNSRVIHRIKSLTEGKAIFTSGANQEKDLIEQAYELAESGKDVAVVSMGDSAVYGLAVLLQQMLPDDGHIKLEIVPGLPEFICANALIGTTLSDDFAVMSLSTRLTAAETVLFRLRLIAQSDLTTVLYYPAEKDSPELLAQVIAAYSEFRPPDTVVAMVLKPYRNNQEIVIRTLDTFLEENISDAGTIFICSEDCRRVDDHVLGKRGYII